MPKVTLQSQCQSESRTWTFYSSFSCSSRPASGLRNFLICSDIIAPLTPGELSVWLTGLWLEVTRGLPTVCRGTESFPCYCLGGQERDAGLDQRDCDEWMDWGPTTVAADTIVPHLERCFWWLGDRADKLTGRDKTETRAVKRHRDIAFGEL